MAFSDDVRRPRRRRADLVAIGLTSFVLTCAVAPWVMALRGPELRVGTEPPPPDGAAPIASDAAVDEPLLQAALSNPPDSPAEALAPPAAVARLDPPVANRLPQPSAAPNADEPDGADIEPAPDVLARPAGATAPGVTAKEAPVRSIAPAEGAALPLRQAALVPPVEAPTLAPARVEPARSPPLARRLPAIPKPMPPLQPSRIPVDPGAPDRTASITGLPKPPRGSIDTSAVVRASTRRSPSEPASRPQAIRAPAAPWRLPSALAPTD